MSSTTPIQSDSIRLNPGFDYSFNGKVYEIRDAVVRLLTVEELDRIESGYPDPVKRRAITLAKSLVRLGELTEIDEFVLQKMLGVDRDRLEASIVELQQKVLRPYVPGPALAVSDAIELNPGLLVNNQHITTAKLKLLTMTDQKAIWAEPQELRLEASLAASIFSFGDVEDRAIIRSAIGGLTTPDQDRLDRAFKALEAKYTPTTQKQEGATAYVIRHCDVLTDEFTLKPGVEINDQVVTTCVGRLRTQAEFAEIERIQDEQEALLVGLAHNVYSLGAYTDRDLIREAVRHLIFPDAKLIEEKVDALRRSFPGYESEAGEAELA
jgi:hypothetical protein